MRKLSGRALGPLTSDEASAAIRGGQVRALFQPIEALQTGVCCGFEALARLERDGDLIAPTSFITQLNGDDRLCLFGEMLGKCIALLKRGGDALGGLYVSINVEVSLLVSDDFIDVLRYFLERHDFEGERLVLEILESEEIVDLSKLQAILGDIKRLGLSLALDDIGSGYASLAKLRDLPVDIVKLDRSFSRDLEMHPEDLIFVVSILSLAQGLDKRMVVEGIETAEVYDALRVMGVELGQGYGIAAPMPADEVQGWLAGRIARDPSRVPRCLLGAYGSLLTVVESCRVLRRQPLPVAWTKEVDNYHDCVIGRLFGARGWHQTAFGEAHKRFHEILPHYDSDEARWRQSAEHFLAAMAEAMTARPHEMRCEALAAPRPQASPRPAKKRAGAR